MTPSSSVTLRMRLHGAINAWNYFYKPQLAAYARAWPKRAKAAAARLWLETRLAVLLLLLEAVTKELQNLTNNRKAN